MSELLEIDRFRNYSDAAMAKALLEGAGIRCVLGDANSNDLFSGCIGATRVEVSAADAPRARELLAQVHAAARARRVAAAARRAAGGDGAAAGDADVAEGCLSCGAPLAADATVCAACGFTFEGEEIHLFANGPLPDSLLAEAFTPADSQRFALPATFVQRYVDWCVAGGLVIVGWETWVAATLGHELRDQFTGNAGALCLAARATLAQGDRATELRFSPTTAAADGAADESGDGDDLGPVTVTPSS